MNATIQARRRPLPTILTVYRPIEEYREAVAVDATEDTGLVDPLDAYLLHRMLDLVPGEPVLVDAAIGATGGASSLIGLNHPRVRSVWGVAGQDADACREAVSSLRGHLNGRWNGHVSLDVLTDAEMPPGLARGSSAVILLDATGDRSDSIAEEVGRWLDRRPEAIVLVLGLGKLGPCPALSSLVVMCTPESGLRFDLLREQNEVLMASRLGMIARRDNAGASLALERLRLSYTGNFRYIDLLRQVNDTAMREAKIDVDTLRANWTFGPLAAEIEDLKRAAREAEDRAAAATQALSEAQGWFGRHAVVQEPAPPACLAPVLVIERRTLIQNVRHRLSPTPVGGAWRLAKRVRRKLSPTAVGGAWRLAKRVRRKLAPTPVGGAWRLAKRSVGSVVGRRG